MDEEKAQPSKMMDLTSLGLALDVLKSNPMLNSVVLRNLFKIVPLEDLKNMRGVCKLWWEVSLPVVRSNSRIRIKGPIGEGITHKYEDYMALISTTEDDKFGFLRHPFGYFLFSWGNEGGEVLEFCTRFGSQIKRLSLWEGYFFDNDIRKIMFELLPNLESLFLRCNEFEKESIEVNQDQQSVCTYPVQPSETMKMLVIHQRVEGPDELWKLPLSWLEIFQHYPALTTLELHGIESGLEPGVNTEFEKILLAMKPVSENTGRKWKIAKLDILSFQTPYDATMLFTPIVLSYLRELEFPLRSLQSNPFIEQATPLMHELNGDFTGSLAIPVVNEEEAALEVINMYSPKLQELIIGSLLSTIDFLNTIRLDSLSKLHLIGEKCRDLKFLRSMPNLKCLWIEDGNNLDSRQECIWIWKPFQSLQTSAHLWRSPWNEFEEAGKLPETVHTIKKTNFTELDGLVLPYLEEFVVLLEICSSEHLWALLKLMPSLKKLGIGLDNDGFRMVCKNLNGLTALDIYPSRVDQYGLTGILPGLDIQLPNITDLKDLRYFGIGRALTSAGVLTDDAVNNGILLFPHLNDLSVYCSKNMSEQTFDQLRRKYPKSIIRRSNN